MQFSILFLTVFFFVNEAFVVKPQGLSGGTGNAWIYFGRGLNQKEIIDIAASKPNPEDKAETTAPPAETIAPVETTVAPVETTDPVEAIIVVETTSEVKAESTAVPVESTATPVESTPEVNIESTAAPEVPTTAEFIANVKTEITTAAPEVLPLEKILSTALPETTAENIRGLPESVFETTENPQPETTSESLPSSTLAPVEAVTPEAPKTEVKEVKTTSSPERPLKIKIVVIPKEYTEEPSAPTEAPEVSVSEKKSTELPTPTEAPSEKSKPGDSSSSSEENHYLKPDLHSMLRRIYKGNGPLHH